MNRELTVWANKIKNGKVEIKHYRGISIYYIRDGWWITDICCGERYAHISPGLLFNCEEYRGSYSDDWHGGPSGSLNDMIHWLLKVEYPELGSSLWMEDSYV